MSRGHLRIVWPILGLVCLVLPGARAEVVTYSLENVVLEEGPQMLGSFTWTFDAGDFENGVGQFTFLDIPYTSHDHTDLDSAFDIGHSIEITLAGSVHDDGVDITLVLTQPLTPTTGSTIDLELSRYEIGGNGFHTGLFLGGSVMPAGATDVGDAPAPPTATLAAFPNPFNPATTLAYDLPRAAAVRITIHDVAGRVVRTLVDGARHDAGRFEATWRGRDDAGRTVAAGTYFARMRAGDQTVIRKVMLLK